MGPVPFTSHCLLATFEISPGFVSHSLGHNTHCFAILLHHHDQHLSSYRCTPVFYLCETIREMDFPQFKNHFPFPPPTEYHNHQIRLYPAGTNEISVQRKWIWSKSLKIILWLHFQHTCLGSMYWGWIFLEPPSKITLDSGIQGDYAGGAGAVFVFFPQ